MKAKNLVMNILNNANMKHIKIYLMLLLLTVVGVGEMWGYSISITKYPNSGTVTLSPGSSVSAGTTVTVTVTPPSGYYCPNSVEVVDEYTWYGMYYIDESYNEDYTKVNTGVGRTTFTFTMPAYNIYLFVNYKEISKEVIEYHTPTCVTSPRDGDLVDATNYATATAIEGYTFEGWTTNGSYTNSTTKPTGLDDRRPGAPAIASEELYAVYSSYSGTPAAETFDVCGGAISAGYYVFSTNKSGADCNAISGSEDGRSHMSPTSITGSNTTATMNPSQRDAVWQVEASDTYWTFKNMESGKYLAATETNNQLVLVNAITEYAKWNVAVVNEGSKTYRIWNKTNSTSAIKYYNSSGSNVFASSSSGTTGNESILYLFKKTTAPGFGQTTTYTINPTCPTTAFTVTYNGNGNTGGTVPVDANEYEYGEYVAIQAGIPTKSGYDFAGWLSSYNGNTYDSNNTFGPEFFYMGDENITLTAQWTPRVVTYLYGSSCEPLENITVTYNDAGTTWTRDYGVGTPVTVDSEVGSKGCTDWVFVGWQRGSAVANNSTSYTPVHNFTATAGDDEAVFYAVYDSVGTDWISALNISELKSGAEYVIVKRYADTKHYALTTTVASTNYLAGSLLGTDCETVKDASNNNRYKLKVTPTADMKWEASNVGGYWRLYNKALGEYLNVNTSNYAFTSTTYDEFTAFNGYNNSEIKIQDRGDSKYLYWYNSGPYWEGYGNAGVFGMHTNAQKFTSTPPCSPRSVTFHGNGGTVSDGVNSGANLVVTEASRDAGITTPTATFADCNGKSWSFVGWIDREVDVTRVPVLTTEMIDDGGGNKHHDISADNEEYWAVYTNTGTPETKYGTINITASDVAGEYREALTFTKNVAETDFGFEFYHVGNQSTLGIQFDYNIATRGYIKNTTSLGKINSISFSSFGTGSISSVQVYVGNSPETCTTLLTAAELQTVGGVSTYYPKNNYAYLKIQATAYVGIGTISIDFGKGTQVWATTPDCSTITLSGDVRVTSTASKTVKGVTALTVNARQLKANTALSFAAYNVADDTPNTHFGFDGSVSADASGLVTDQTIVVTYTPAADATTDGIEDVYFKATALADDDVTTTESNKQAGYGRHLPANFVIAAKWGDKWYALPANCTTNTSPTTGVLIEVDNALDPTRATAAPSYTKWGLQTVRPGRQATNGSRLVFTEQVTTVTADNQKTLYNGSTTNIQANAQYGNYATTNPDNYEWLPTTTDLKDYILTSATILGGDASARTISLSNKGVFGTLLINKSNDGKVRILPADFYEPVEMQVIAWKANSLVVMYGGTGIKATTQVGNNDPSSLQTLASVKVDHGVYELSTSQALTSSTNMPLTITVKNGSDVTTGTCALIVPAIVTGVQDAPLGLTADEATLTDVVVTDGATLSAAATKYTFKNITVYPGGKLVIGSGKQLGMASLTLRGGSSWGAATYEHKYPQFVLNNTASGAYTNSSAVINYDYVTTKDQYYSFVLPYDGRTSAIKYPVDIYGSAVSASNTGSFEFQYYDGAARAAGGTGWKVLAEPATLVAGTGYTFLGMPKKIYAYDGTETRTNVRQQYGIHRIPMSVAAATVQAGETGEGEPANKPISINVILASKNNNSGWNLIGNPYMSNVSGLSNTDIQVGKLVHTEDANGNWTGGWHWDNPTTGVRYIVTTDDGQTFESQQASTATLKAFKNFFVQIQNAEATSLVIPANTRTDKNLAPARYTDETEQDIRLAVNLVSDARKDKVDLLINDIYTAAFDQDGDFTKMMNGTNFNLYGVYPEDYLSFIAVDKTTAAGNIAIGYQVPAGGEYTLQLSDREYVMTDAIEALYVTDHEVSPEVTTDLLDGPYNFTVNQAETNNTRFTVSIRLAPMTPTDIGNVPDDGMSIDNAKPRKFIWQDKMYILRNGVIYDATGKQVGEINK